jgi:hypothetical protein
MVGFTGPQRCDHAGLINRGCGVVVGAAMVRRADEPDRARVIDSCDVT